MKSDSKPMQLVAKVLSLLSTLVSACSKCYCHVRSRSQITSLTIYLFLGHIRAQIGVFSYINLCFFFITINCTTNTKNKLIIIITKGLYITSPLNPQIHDLIHNETFLCSCRFSSATVRTKYHIATLDYMLHSCKSTIKFGQNSHF